MEKLEEKFQRKCEEAECLQRNIEEKEIIAAEDSMTDVAVDVAADLKDVEFTGDTGHVNVISDGIQKAQEIFEAEAEMPKTQSWEECIAIAVEEKALQEGIQGDTGKR